MLANLLTNSAKYTPRGGRVWLLAEAAGGRVVAAVRDTGIGIPAEARALLSTPVNDPETPERTPMSATTKPPSLARELAPLDRMTMAELREKFAPVVGEPTTGGNRAWLIRRIGWRM